MNIEKLINWSNLARHITGGDRNSIRTKKIPRKWWPAIDMLIYKDLPSWWESVKTDNYLTKK